MSEQLGKVERLAVIADKWRLTNLQPQLEACRALAQAKGRLDVAVLGRFKAGKSSFLNHLIGRDVLPIGVVPLTAVNTRLRHAPVERATVRFLHGEVRAISLEEIGLFVGEKENPGNAKRVASVDVELPDVEPLAPLEFVDTPGLGSALLHNTETALNWLPNVGAALVAVSSDAPLSERDLSLLDDLRRHTPRIVLLLTKADLLTEAQRGEVLEFVRQQLLRKRTMQLPVFFYSVKSELAELKTALVDQLLVPLRQGCGTASEEILRHKLASLASQTRAYLRVSLAAATQADSARQALRARLDEERHEWELLREELQGLVHDWGAGALEGSLARLEPTRANLQAKAAAELKMLYQQGRLRLPALLRMWREWLRAFLVRELTEVSRAEQPMFREPVGKARAHLERTLQAFQDRLARHVRDALGVTLAPCDLILEVSDPSAPPVDVGYGLDVALDMTGSLVPMTLFRRPVERVLMRKARWEVEKNLSRLAAAWRDRVAAAITELTRQAERHALNEMAVLEVAVEQTTSKAPELRNDIESLNGFQIRRDPD